MRFPTLVKAAVAVATVPAYLVVTAITPHAAVAQAAVTPAARTCAAYAAWHAHPTTVRLNAMMTASFSAPWKYTGEDADGLYSDVRSHSAAKYIAKDEKYFTEDCKP
jgi:hypothetical protein